MLSSGCYGRREIVGFDGVQFTKAVKRQEAQEFILLGGAGLRVMLSILWIASFSGCNWSFMGCLFQQPLMYRCHSFMNILSLPYPERRLVSTGFLGLDYRESEAKILSKLFHTSTAQQVINASQI